MADERINRRVVVAGGSGALGRPIAAAISALGFTTLTLSRRKRIRGLPASIEHFSGDLTDERSLRRVMDRIAKLPGQLWAVVNCAGCNVIRPCDQYSAREFRRIIDVNLYGAMLLAKFAIPLLKKGGGGKIINIASQAGLDAQAGNTAYSAAKAGVIAFGNGLARELAPVGISIVTVCPGDIESPMMDRAMRMFAQQRSASPAAIRSQLRDSIPAARLGTSVEIADVVAHLLQIETPFLTGASIVVAGGRTCH